MTDAALAALQRRLGQLPTPLWWFADEQCSEPPPLPPPECQVFSNRCDIANGLTAAGYAVALGDFALPEQGPAAVAYRVSKEKPLVHYLLNLALQRLPLGGTLLLSGYKNDGLKTYAAKAAKLVASQAELTREGGGVYVATIRKVAQPEGYLPDSDYAQLREIASEPPLLSKPGVFGWQKIDRGSALLISQLTPFLAEFTAPPQRLADLGCGYGYLAVMAHQQLPGSEWLLTDNNATAMLAAAQNCTRHGIAAQCYLADCAEGVPGPVDAVLCNPPFHQGFAVAGDLTLRFLQAAHGLLRPGGQALFVVNQFISLQRQAQGLFVSEALLLERDGFRVIRLRKATTPFGR